MLSNIRIVLVNTSHPGNIGGAARAMKTMGLSDLYLVAPEQFPHAKAKEMASSALDVVLKARVVNTVDEALGDIGLIIGTSARSRTIPWPMLSMRELGPKVFLESAKNKVAILFGPEQSGLTNEILHRCHFHIQIPANPDYSSLNLAQAVQVVAYELRMASLDSLQKEEWDYRYATGDEMENFYEHVEKILIKTDFLKPAVPRQLMTRLRRLFNRIRVDELEIKMLRGILKAIDKKMQ